MNPDESFLKKLDTDLSTGKVTPDMRRSTLHREKQRPVADDWVSASESAASDDPYANLTMKRTQQKSLFKKFFVAACVFAVVAVGVFMFTFLTGRARLTGEHVAVTVQAKTFADSGEEVNVRVSVRNDNTVPMQFTTLKFNYPLGTALDQNATKEISRDLGTIGPGETHDETYSIQLFGDQGAEKAMTAMVEYRLQGDNAIFQNTGNAKLVLRSSIATLTADAPAALLSGQQLPITLTATGNSANTVASAMVTADYPDGCSFVSADPAPTLDNNLWYLGDLPAGAQKVIKLVISCSGITNSQSDLRFTLGKQSATNERQIESVYTGTDKIVTLSAPFLATQVLVNGVPFDKTTALFPNRETTIDIPWSSTSDTPINHAVIKIHLSGAAFDPTRLSVGAGFYDSATNTITYSENEIPGFSTITPGQSDRIGFSITPRAGLASASKLDISVSISGVLAGGETRTLTDATTASIPLASDLQLLPKTLYHSGPLVNTGPMPMQVGKETTFTIIWQLSNSTNPIADAVVKTTLPTGVVWKNVVAPVTSANTISYNTVTREIVWNAGDVPVGQNAKSIAFKLAIDRKSVV